MNLKSSNICTSSGGEVFLCSCSKNFFDTSQHVTCLDAMLGTPTHPLDRQRSTQLLPRIVSEKMPLALLIRGTVTTSHEKADRTPSPCRRDQARTWTLVGQLQGKLQGNV